MTAAVTPNVDATCVVPGTVMARVVMRGEREVIHRRR